MGHYCRLCNRNLPNERFSGKGHKTHICKNCQKMPKVKRNSIEWKDEIYGFLNQSHISKKNIARLKIFIESEDPEVVELAEIVYQVACIKPYKKKRLKYLAQKNRELLIRLEETGLIFAHHFR